MSQNPLERVQAGQPPPLSARRENLISDVLADFLGRGNKNGLTTSSDPIADQTLIRVRNDTGLDLDRYNIIKIGDPVFGPDDNLDEFKERPTFKGVAITASSERYAVLQEPLAAGDRLNKAYGMARITGLTIAKVNKNTATIGTNEFASCTTDQTKFNGNSPGSIQVLWREGKVGDQWAVVHLRAGAASTCPAINTIWQIVFWGSLADLGGTFKLQFKTDSPTSALAYNVSTASMQAALESSSSIGSGNVSVTGGPYSWTVEFIGDLASAPASPLALDASGLTGPYLGFNCYLVQAGHD